MKLTMPSHHLLRTSDTLRRVLHTPNWGLWNTKLLSRGAAGDFAPVVLHVHVGNAA